jgi:hypothetical protein
MPIFMDSTRGNDASSGTQATPFRTLARAQLLAGAASWTTTARRGAIARLEAPEHSYSHGHMLDRDFANHD